MTTATASTPTAPARDGFSVPRTLQLARWNLILLARNKLALTYGTVLPLAGMLFLVAGERGSLTVGASALGGVLVVAGMFPVYYNVLSQFVNRRDELVLKRMRTGETRDSELLLGIAIPGALCAVAVCAVAVPIAVALGQELPLNPVLYAVGVLLVVVMFGALAYWTAAFTRNAEAAQLTSLPVIMVVIAGQVAVTLPNLSDTAREVISYTPGAAINEIVRVGWFGLDGVSATEATLSFADTWAASAQPLLVLVAWSAVAVSLASRSMRWEPRG